METDQETIVGRQFFDHAPKAVCQIVEELFRRVSLPTANSILSDELIPYYPSQYTPFSIIKIPISGNHYYIAICHGFLDGRSVTHEDINFLKNWCQKYTISTLILPYFPTSGNEQAHDTFNEPNIRLVRVPLPVRGANLHVSDYFILKNVPSEIIARSNMVASELNKQLRKTAHIFLSDVAAESYDDAYASSSAGTMFAMKEEERVLDRFVKSIHKPDVEMGVALELGCGTGRHSFELAQRFDNVYAYDFSRKMIEVAQRKKAESTELDRKKKKVGWKATFSVRDVEMHPPTFDGESITLCAGLFGMGSFVEDIESFVEKYAALIKPGGGMILSFYNRDALVYSSPPPWRYPAISARLEIDRNELIVTLPDGDIFRIFCRGYAPNELTRLFSRYFSDVEVHTFPIISGFLPKEYVDGIASNDRTRDAIEAIDRALVSADVPPVGNYILIHGKKPTESEKTLLVSDWRANIEHRLRKQLPPKTTIEIIKHISTNRGAEIADQLQKESPYISAILVFHRVGKGINAKENPMIVLSDARNKIILMKLAEALKKSPKAFRIAHSSEFKRLVGTRFVPLPLCGYESHVKIIIDQKVAEISEFICSRGELESSIFIRGAKLCDIEHHNIFDVT